MSVLERDSYERMAKGISEGLTQDKAYVGAGYSPNSAAVGATNLLKRHPEIKVRAQELRQEKSEMFARANILPVAKVANELGINKRLILSELLDNAMISKAAVPVMKGGEPTGVYTANISASNQAFMMLGKELGMFTDKVEHSKVTELTQKTDEELVVYIKDKYRKLGLDMDITDAKLIENK